MELNNVHAALMDTASQTSRTSKFLPTVHKMDSRVRENDGVRMVLTLNPLLPCRWRQGRDEGAGTWRTCPLRVQRRRIRSFRRGLSQPT